MWGQKKTLTKFISQHEALTTQKLKTKNNLVVVVYYLDIFDSYFNSF